MRDYTPEYETYRDDAIAVLNGTAVVLAVTGVWFQPILMGAAGLATALLAYFLSPRSKGRTVAWVIMITVFAVVIRWIWGYDLM